MLRSLVTSLAVVASMLVMSCGGDSGSDPPVVIRTPTNASDGSAGTPGTPPAPSGETNTVTGSATPAVPGTATPTPSSDGSIVVACGDILAPLDKQHRLPADCVPAGLVAFPDAYSYGGGQLMVGEAADALVELIEAAASDGIFIYVISSYRSYEHQVGTYNNHVVTYGEEYANRVSARPGHSEHQLGTTADVISASAGYVLENFPGTPEAAWVAENAVRFGFIVSYPEGLESVTGYSYEPWHIRYVGRQLADDVAASGLTLGQYLLGSR